VNTLSIVNVNYLNIPKKASRVTQNPFMALMFVTCTSCNFNHSCLTSLRNLQTAWK